MIAKRQFRQGDVFMRRVKKLPKGAEKDLREGGRLIVAHGEVTGHCHEVTVPDMSQARLVEVGGQMHLVVEGEEPATIVHDEHGAIGFEAGMWERRPQVEFSDVGMMPVRD